MKEWTDDIDPSDPEPIMSGISGKASAAVWNRGVVGSIPTSPTMTMKDWWPK